MAPSVTRTYHPRCRTGRKVMAIPGPWDPECTPYCVTEEEFPAKTRDLCATEVSNALSTSSMVRVAKVIVLGDMSVGKTSLVNRFCYEVFDYHYKATIGVDFEVERYEVLGVPFNLQIWDTAGAERFRCIASSYYRAAHVIILAFDMSVPLTMGHCLTWLEAAMESWDPKLTSKPLIFLVGCKEDLLNPDDYESVLEKSKECASKIEAEFWPVSAKTGKNVQEFFLRVAALSFGANVRDQLRREKSRQRKEGRQKSIVRLAETPKEEPPAISPTTTTTTTRRCC